MKKNLRKNINYEWKKNNMPKVFLLSIGIIGFIAGIFLTINGDKIMGLAGSVASAAIAIKGINELRKEKKAT
ncbi:hypothetical protein ACWBC2_09520 [Salegentibacter agarivorans]